MDVTKENFDAVLPEITRLASECDFVAIDCELSGLDPDGAWRRAQRVDTGQVRFRNTKTAAEQYILWQLGVCFFVWDGTKHVAAPFNINLFPRGNHSQYTIQASSLAFLADHKFDFNKAIINGVPYLSRQAMQRKLARAEERRDEPLDWAVQDRVRVNRPSDVDFVRNLRARLRDWDAECAAAEAAAPATAAAAAAAAPAPVEVAAVADAGAAAADVPATASAGDAAAPADDGVLRVELSAPSAPSLVLAPCNRFLRRVAYEVVAMEFPGMLCSKVDEEAEAAAAGAAEPFALGRGQARLRVTRFPTPAAREAAQRAERIAAFEESVRGIREKSGALQILDALSAAKTPLVGHNCFTDLLHVYAKMHGPLPSDVAEFATSLLSLHPLFFDTKHLLTSSRDLETALPNTSLECAFGWATRLGRACEIREDLKLYTETSDAAHEAGYDAYMTGSVFLAALSELGFSREDVRASAAAAAVAFAPGTAKDSASAAEAADAATAAAAASAGSADSAEIELSESGADGDASAEADSGAAGGEAAAAGGAGAGAAAEFMREESVGEGDAAVTFAAFDPMARPQSLLSLAHTLHLGRVDQALSLARTARRGARHGAVVPAGRLPNEVVVARVVLVTGLAEGTNSRALFHALQACRSHPNSRMHAHWSSREGRSAFVECPTEGEAAAVVALVNSATDGCLAAASAAPFSQYEALTALDASALQQYEVVVSVGRMQGLIPAAPEPVPVAQAAAERAVGDDEPAPVVRVGAAPPSRKRERPAPEATGDVEEETTRQAPPPEKQARRADAPVSFLARARALLGF